MTFVEHNPSRGNGRVYNATPVWVCTKLTTGAHDPRCAACTRLTRKGFNELQQPSSRKNAGRRRFQSPHNQQSTKDLTPDTPDDVASLVEYHLCPDEDDIQDDAAITRSWLLSGTTAYSKARYKTTRAPTLTAPEDLHDDARE